MPTASLAATVTLTPTANTTAGTVTNPTNAYTDNAAYANIATSASSSEIVRGFTSTDLGTITDVTVYVQYKTSAAPGNDTYAFNAASDGVTFGTTIVAASLVNRAAEVPASVSLGALTWAQVGTLAVRGQTTRSGTADGYTLDWDVGYIVVTYTPLAGSINVGNATTGEAATTLAPGDPEVVLDAFSLTATAGTATPSSVTVTMPAGSTALIESLSIENTSACDQASPYGGPVAPGSDTPTINVSGLSVGTSAVPLWVCVKPKTHANMDPPATGTQVAVTGRVTGVAAPSYSIGTLGDLVSSPRTIDNLSPTPVISGLSGAPGSGSVVVSWTTEPAVADFTTGGEVVVLVRQDAAPAVAPVEGTNYDGGETIVAGTTVGCVAAPGAKSCTVGSLTVGNSYYFTAFARDACFNYSVTSASVGPYQPSAFVGEGDTTDGSTKPVVSIVNPGPGPVGLPVRVQARVYSPSGDVGTVQLLIDGVAYGTNLSPSTYYSTTTTSGIWQLSLPTLTAGNHVFQVEASNASGSVRSRKVNVSYSSLRTGDGNLLVRDNASRFCEDCHAGTLTHSAETTSNKRGSWSLACRDCHTPHSTTNIGLVRQQITPPSYTTDEAPRTVEFRSRTGGATAGPVNPAGTGVCQVCHTQTKFYTQTQDYTAEATGPHETGTNCLSCHDHKQGLKGGCTTCHGLANRPATVAGADSNISAAPPALASPAPTGQVTLGDGHMVHMDQNNFRDAPIKCVDCHATYNTHKDGRADVKWGTLAKSNSFVPTPADGWVDTAAGWPGSPTCTNWCHGQGLAGGGGPSSFSWTSTAPLGCSSCHGAPPPVDSTAAADHPFNIYCSNCHGPGYIPMNLQPEARLTHLNGVVNKPANGCTACHGVLAGLAGPAVDRLSPTVAPGYDASAVDTMGNPGSTRTAPGVGAHVAHVNSGALMSGKCVECHALPVNGDTGHADAALDWGWTTIAGVVPSYTRPNCTNYCHSNAAPLAGTVTTVSMSWTTDPGQLGCTACHKTTAAGATDLSSRHGRHLAYAYNCDECHANTMQAGSSNTIGDVAMHANGAKDWQFSTSLRGTVIDQSAGTYSGYTCSGTYCHSPGTKNTAFDAPVGPALSWNGGTADVECDSCHGGDASASSKLASGSHTGHVNEASYLGTNFGCVTCHRDTVDNIAPFDDRALNATTGLTFHVDGSKDVSATSWNGTSCANNRCHSNGTELPLIPADYQSVTWGGTLANDCKGCHGGVASFAGEPSYANDTGSYKTRNSHAAHVASTDTTAVCYVCHSDTVALSGALVSGGTKHLDLDDVADVKSATAQIGSYTDATETCNTVSCHGNNSPQWGTTIDCSGCHMGAQGVGVDAEVDNYVYGVAPMAMLDPEDWINYGHGKPSGSYDSGNTAAGFDTNIAVSVDDGCKYCHTKSVLHGVTTNPFRLANVGAGTTIAEKVAVCTVCHGGAGYLSKGPGKAIDATHYGTKHPANGKGGELCWDCHDPHGDSRYVASNATETPTVASDQLLGYMIDAKPVRSHTTAAGVATEWGQNGILYGLAPIFRANLSGGATAYDWGDFVQQTTLNGVCQACHTQTVHFTNSTWSVTIPSHPDADANHNSGQSCVTVCHKHDQPPASAFQGAGSCSTCHMATAAATHDDFDSYGVGGAGLLDPEDWTTYGHGRLAASGAYTESGNPAGNVPLSPTVEGCYYCHAPDTAIAGGNGDISAHGDAADPFRLTNDNWNAAGRNGVCLVCHNSTDGARTISGFDPDGSGNALFAKIDASAASRIDAAHYGADHVANGKGGQYCWDCHDPHGDYNETNNRPIAYMIQEKPVRTHATAADANNWGVPDKATELATYVDFYKAGGLDAANFDGGDYVRNASPWNGVCQTCHTQTLYWKNTASSTHEFAAAGSAQPKCTACHAHNQGTVDAFKQATACTACHAAPPANGEHAFHVGVSTPAYGDTAPHSAAGAYAFGCGKCHATPSSVHWDDVGGTAADPFVVDVAFDWASGATPYTAGAASNDAAASGLVYKTSPGTCATYCHSDGQPLGAASPTFKSPTWAAATYTLCTECHNTTTTLTTNAHAKHLNATTNPVIGTAYVCADCHVAVVSTGNSPISDKSLHVNGGKDASFPARNTMTSAAYASPNCNSNYCHSSGRPLTTGSATAFDFHNLAWNSAGTLDCKGCHGAVSPGDFVSQYGEPNYANGGANVVDSNSHKLHVNAVTDCNNCHTSTSVTGTSIVTGSLLHTDGQRQVTIPAAFDSDANPANNYATGTKTCSSTRCHGTNSPVWGAALGCNVCHGAPPSGANSGAHAKHEGTVGTLPSAYADTARTSSTKYGIACSGCHAGTHGNGTGAPWTVEVSAGLSYAGAGATVAQTELNGQVFNWTTNKTCATDCHSDGGRMQAGGTYVVNRINPTGWNATLGCNGCHGVAGATTTLSLAHINHVNTGTYSMPCQRCHATTVNTSGAISDFSVHVNLARNTSGGSFTSPGGTAINDTGMVLQANHTCTASYCHSNGQSQTAPFTSTSNAWNAAAPACTSCHVTTALTSGSHAAHLAAPNSYGCIVCHSTVAATNTSIAAGGYALHVDGEPTVAMQATYGGTYSLATHQCSSVSCHGSGTPTWGTATSVNCRSCHGKTTGAADDDVDNWSFASPLGSGVLGATNPMTRVDIDDWSTYGHGKTSGTYAQSTHAAAVFDGATSGMTPTKDGCVYCHLPLTGADHDTTLATNPFRLANVTTTTQNGVCTVCHAPGSAGYNPGAGLIKPVATQTVDSYHYGADHTTSGNFGGGFCWDCHDPHGDYNFTQAKALAFMFQEYPTVDNSGGPGVANNWGIPLATPTLYVNFYDATDGAAGWNVRTDYYTAATAPNGKYNGVCQVCHPTSSVTALHFTDSAAPETGHNGTTGCMVCHKHQQAAGSKNLAFKGEGSCLGCHAGRTGTIPRAIIVNGTAGSEGDDFIRNSRHVSNGTTNPIVTDYDCILCHAEGDLASAGNSIKTITSNHGGDSGGNKNVDLRDVDSAGGTGIAASWPGNRLSTFTANTTQRNAMDDFCMGCHDTNGASTVAVNDTNPANGMLYSGTSLPTLAQAQKPFNINDNLRNLNDAAALGTWRTTTNGKVIDVKSQFNTGNQPGKSWASHHNLNKYTKRYNTNNNTYLRFATFTTYVTKEGLTLNSATGGTLAGLHCSDCHLNEANAHGSRASWYMLTNSTGADASFNFSGLTTSTDNCSRCHAPAVYGKTAGTNSRTGAHDGDCSRVDSAGGEYSNSGAILGRNTTGAKGEIACLLCHGGLSPGMIHGTNGSYNPYNGATASKQYRFMGTGGSMRWYSPVGATAYTAETQWEGAGTYGCYTIGAADTFGGCTQHNTGRAGSAQNYTRPLQY